MSLDLKYRPQDLDEFYGSDSLIFAVEEYLNDENRKHAILLHGPSGCGKTTLGRIITTGLGCTILAPPNFLEFDLTIARGIKDAKEKIVYSCRYAPLTKKGVKRVKVYLLDEAHQLTKDGASALLKTIEEPPPFVYFIFCTTEPEKLLETIRTRCTKFRVDRLDSKDMTALVSDIAGAEGIVLPSKVLRKLVSVSEGCPRDALNYLGQVRNLDEEVALDILSGGIQEPEIIELCRILADRKPGDKWAKIQPKLQALNADPEKARLAVYGYFASWVAREQKAGAAAYPALIATYFSEPFYHSGKNDLILAFYQICREVDG